MSKLEAPVAALTEIADKKSFIAGEIDFELLKFFGIFVLKKAFDVATIEKYARSYFESANGPGLQKKEFHLTEMAIGEGQELRSIVAEKEFVKAVSGFFGGNVGVDFIRVVRKDKENFQPVFRHQDTCYQIGGIERYSLFIPLTRCHFENGGLVLYPGTHNYGYLGDAGEIRDILPAGYPKVATDASPGDVLIMHSATWHESPVNSALTDRVYLEVHIQDINEPTTKIEVCGKRHSQWKIPLGPDEIFNNSRTQRIKALYGEIESLKAPRQG